MKEKIFLGFFMVALLLINSSCKTKKVLIESNTNAVAGVSQKQVSEKYYATQLGFKTLYLKTDIDYQDDKRAQSVTAEIKIEKDKTILVSVRFLGFTVAKALITPEKVQYYEKLGSKYFEGDYSTISAWLGTDLDFQKIQNLILGQPFDNLSNGKLSVDIQDSNYLLRELEFIEIQKMFLISASNFALLRQEVEQIQKNRKISVEYSNHQQSAEGILPGPTNILAMQGTEKTSVKIDITTARYNEELTFPYVVPNGYVKIEMKP